MALAHRLPCHRLLEVKGGFTVTDQAQYPVRKTDLAVRPSANAQVVAKLPVVGVVPTTVALLGIGRHLVSRHALLGRTLGDDVEHIERFVILGQGGWVAFKPGVGLDGQVVDGQMRWGQAQRGVQIVLQCTQALAWQGVHQVDVEGVKGVPCLTHSGHGLVGVVHPAQGTQAVIVKTLHPHR